MEIDKPDNHLPSLEVLMASIYYLMTRYARLPDTKLSQAISDHFEMLSNHPNCDSEILKKAGYRLASQWKEYLQDEDTNLSADSLFITQSQPKVH